jgi:STE24 endopeptidase
VIYEDFIYLWLAFLIEEFFSFDKLVVPVFVSIFWFLIKEIFFIFSIKKIELRIPFWSSKKAVFVQRFFIFLIFIFYILDLYVFGLKKVFERLLFPCVFAIFWFLHYYILVRISLFKLNTGYIKIILGMLFPFLILVLFEEVLTFFKIEFSGDFILILGFIIIAGPSLMVKVWPMEELKDQDLKELIEDFLRKQGIKMKKIYVLSGAGRKIYTAGVIGFFPNLRYLFFSKSLLELLDADEILGVTAHEIGHIKKKHAFLLFLLLFNLPLFLISSFFFFLLGGSYVHPEFLKIIGDTKSWLGDGIIGGFLIIASFVYIRYIFAYFLRQFEREADLYSLRMLSTPYPIIKALLKIGKETGQLYQKSWHHYGILERVNFLIDAFNNPVSSQRKLKRTKILLFLWFVFNGISVLIIAKYIPSVIKLFKYLI